MNGHPKALQERYAERARGGAALGELCQRAAVDLAALDFLGRYRIANDHW